jgi:hypothetical protein
MVKVFDSLVGCDLGNICARAERLLYMQIHERERETKVT